MGPSDELEVPLERLRWRCEPPPAPPQDGPIVDELDRVGQERARKALRLALEIDAPGYHVFVSGLPGSGRSTAVRRLLDDLADRWVVVRDKAFLHHFADPARPKLLELPGGRLRPFAARMDELANDLIARLESLSEDAAHLKRRRRLEEALTEAKQRRLEELAATARDAGFALYDMKERGYVRPALGIADGDEIFPIEALRLLAQQGRIPAAKAAELERLAHPLREKFERAAIEMRRAARALARELAEFDRDQARTVIRPELDEVAAEFPFDPVRAHLAQIEAWILDRLPHGSGRFAARLRRRLAVNVILDHSVRKESPIVVEPSPTFANLFGSIDVKVTRSGAAIADHRGIRAGALIHADGGYLVLKAEDVLAEEGVWTALKRALKQERVEITAHDAVAAAVALKPQPVPLKVKVVLIGDAEHEELLEERDAEFRKIFKVRAEFDGEMDRTPENLARLFSFLRQTAQEERLLPFLPAALAAIAEEAARRAGRGGKLTTRFAQLADLSREANLFAQRDAASAVDAVHVARALGEAREREDLHEQKLREQIRDGVLMIDTAGERIGQVNALTVASAGAFAFGRPARITATVAAGDHGLVNIEREVQLSGEIHDKGVFILGGLLRERFGQNHPISLVASLCFEQSYGPIDGDSASVAEWFALLSALAWIPLKQGIAVTGSVNQKGDVQPIGAVNEKIEGFFDVCAARGLDGTQGVVIPARNVGDLMLAERVTEAVAARRFRIWAIGHVDAGIAILTGIEAGTLGSDGRYPKESVNGRVADHLWFLAEVARDFKGANDAPHAATSAPAPLNAAPPPAPTPP